MIKLKKDARIHITDAVSDALVQMWKSQSDLQDDVLLNAVFAELESLSDKITDAARSDTVLSSLDKADAVRDEKIRSFSDLLKGYAAVPIPAIKSAAEKLKAVFDKYGAKIASETYLTESASVEMLLRDFADENLKESILALAGAEELILDLRKSQDEFDKARQKFDEDRASRGESAGKVKKALIFCINEKIVPYLSAAALIKPEKYAAFASLVEKEIERGN